MPAMSWPASRGEDPAWATELPHPGAACLCQTNIERRSYSFDTGEDMKSCRYSGLRLLLGFLAMLMLAGTAMSAAIPTAPVRLVATLEENPNGSKYVQLRWLSNHDSNTIAIDGYNIYQAIENNGNYTFSQIGTDTDELNSYEARHQVQVSTAGNYRYYVTAFNDDGESQASNNADVKVYLERITFTSPTPGTRDQVPEGTVYTRDFDAVSSSGETVLYELVSTWPNMQIDAATGVLTWDAVMTGRSYYIVRAYLERDHDIGAIMTVGIDATRNEALYCATIAGFVREDGTNAGVNNARIMVYPINAPDSLAVPYETGTTNGFYHVKVRPGSYHISFYSPGHISEWYLNASSPSQATPVAVECGDTAMASFSVEPRVIHPNPADSIVGRVVDEDGNAVAAIVNIYGLYRNNDSLGQYDSLVGTARTNEHGYYVVFVPAVTNYIAYAEPITDNLLPQWYLRSPNRAGARVINSRHTYGIDFFLERASQYENRISGTLTNHDRDPINGSVTAYVLVQERGKLVPHAVRTVAAANGSFLLEDLEPGTYVLFGNPADSNSSEPSAPGYYKHGNAAREWDKADRLTIDGDDQVTGLEFRLREEKDNKGKNKLRGNVSGSAGQTRRGDRGLLGATPLAGAVVYAIDGQDVINGSAVTDDNGDFVIGGLVKGTYTILVDKIGYIASNSTVTFEAEIGEEMVNEVLDPAQSVSSAPLAPAAGIAASAWPNPAREAVTVRFSGSADTARLTLADATGAQVMVRSIETINGDNSISIQTAGLASGVYFLTLQNGTATTSMPINIVR